jgi:hypothetical protein
MSGTSLTQQVNTMWRTPDAPGDGGPRNRQGSRGKGHQVTIAEQAEHWPTPTGSQQNQYGAVPDSRERVNGVALSDVAMAWPTPAARDAKGANSVEHVTTNGTGRMHMDQLANFVEHSPSSPQAQQIPDGPESLQSTDTLRRRLNPMFGAWLMGWPCWWTNPGITSCAKSEMVSYRSRQQSALSSLLGAPGSSIERK